MTRHLTIYSTALLLGASPIGAFHRLTDFPAALNQSYGIANRNPLPGPKSCSVRSSPTKPWLKKA